MIIDSTVEPVLPVLQAIGKIPSGIFVVTIGKAGDADAMGTLVSFVQQISMEPLYLAVAVKKGRGLGEALQKSNDGKKVRLFVLNVTHAGDKSILRKYAKGSGVGGEAFSGVRSKTLESGSTVLLDACAYLECELVKVVDVGADHDLYVGFPVNGELLGDGSHKPTVHVRHDGSRY